MRLALALVVLVPACIGGKAGPDANLGPHETGESYTVTIGPIDVPAGVEKTQCIEKKLGNVDAKWIGRLRTHTMGVSHHMIVYRMAGTVEQPTPFDCTPFVETLDPANGSPLMVTQIPEETLTLPYGVAFKIDPDQMVRIELHYINTTDSDMSVAGDATFDVMPDAEFKYEAGFLFIGNPDIMLPPMQETTLGPSWFPMPQELADVKIFAMTGHEHRFGTDVEVDQLDSETGTPNTIYSYPSWSWDTPPVKTLDPPLAMPAGSGFSFTCKWNNTSTTQVQFGESANDEMCFFWSYYFPSQGHKVCVHTDRLGAPINLCCPGPDPLCAEIISYLNMHMP
jgi:hypothetical protein